MILACAKACSKPNKATCFGEVSACTKHLLHGQHPMLMAATIVHGMCNASRSQLIANFAIPALFTCAISTTTI